MSEMYPTELEPTKIQTPTGRHAETFAEEPETDDEEQYDSSDAADMDQSVAVIALIGEHEIENHRRNDRDVRERYRDAKADIAAAYEQETVFHKDVAAKIAKDQVDAQEAFRLKNERLEENERLLIAMVTQSFARQRQRAGLEHYSRVSELKEKEILQTSLFKSNEETFQFVAGEIDAGEGQQAQLEDRRDRAIELYNELVDQKNGLVRQADGIERDVTTNERTKYVLEHSRKKHIGDEAELQYQVEVELGPLVGAEILDICNEQGISIEYDKNGSIMVASLPTGIQDLIPGIMNDVSSKKLKTDRYNLKTCQEKIRVVSEEIDDFAELIAGKRLLLDDIYGKLEQLDSSIDKVKAELDGILRSTSQRMDAHSNEATTIAWQLKKVLQGDTSAIAINELHSAVRSVAKNVKTWETFLDSKDDDIDKGDAVDEEEEFAFSEVFGKLLEFENGEDIAALIDKQTDLISNIENGTEILTAVRSYKAPNFTRMIKKGGIFRRGVQMVVGDSGDTSQEG